MMLKLERHHLGPRVFVLGRRVHEWHLGVLAVVCALVLAALDVIEPGKAAVALLLGGWLVVKDWPDLTARGRDQAAWRLGIHRRPPALRPMRYTDDVPAVAALATAAVGLVDLLSAVTPNISWRGRELVHLEPVGVMQQAHALAVPASVALIVTAYYLYRRRALALRLAVGLLLALTVFNVLKGLDFEEACLTAGCAVLLVLSRSSFTARNDPGTLRAAFVRVPLLAGAAFAASLAVVTIAAPGSTPTGAIVRETFDLLLWQPGPFAFRDELARTGLAVELLSILAVVTAAWVVFRPLAAPRDLPAPALRHAAATIVREHGSDTLSFFKLRGDKHYLFDPSGAAFLGYRVESGVLMVSGDPVGTGSAVADLTRELVTFAEARSLRIAALGVSESGRALLEEAGLRALYLGDEAIVDTDSFSLEGRSIRKVRQSVSRLEKAGYAVRTEALSAVDDRLLGEFEQVAESGRAGCEERGFSMAMDSLRNPHCADTLIVYAVDESGVVGGFLQFVPTYGRNAASLSLMRRRPDAPNGLTEFLVVRAIEALRERGVREVSLNFAAFARLLREPEGLLERAAGRAIALGDTWFQIERLYRFNAKFFPRWEPRYFMYERRFGLPRAGIAALWIEGQLPKPLGRRAA
jgi:lysyl-tRNA synthetase class 2